MKVVYSGFILTCTVIGCVRNIDDSGDFTIREFEYLYTVIENQDGTLWYDTILRSNEQFQLKIYEKGGVMSVYSQSGLIFQCSGWTSYESPAWDNLVPCPSYINVHSLKREMCDEVFDYCIVPNQRLIRYFQFPFLNEEANQECAHSVWRINKFGTTYD
jgi:hypothetical protein